MNFDDLHVEDYTSRQGSFEFFDCSQTPIDQPMPENVIRKWVDEFTYPVRDVREHIARQKGQQIAAFVKGPKYITQIAQRYRDNNPVNYQDYVTELGVKLPPKAWEDLRGTTRVADALASYVNAFYTHKFDNCLREHDYGRLVESIKAALTGSDTHYAAKGPRNRPTP